MKSRFLVRHGAVLKNKWPVILRIAGFFMNADFFLSTDFTG